MPIELALYQPEIPQNTGTLIRLGACLGVTLHIIHPTGFLLSKKTLKRGGLDYLDHATFLEHTTFADFDAFRRNAGKRLVLLTTKAGASAYAADFAPDDIIMVGRESAGVPAAVAAVADLKLRIPMRQDMRSLNVAIAATLVLGEALRQTGAYETMA
jgi:tRNA (cytidine/uridine-2'-O-)-methyltransferase